MIKQAIESCGFVEFDDGRREDVVLYKRDSKIPQNPMIVVTASGDQYACSVEEVNELPDKMTLKERRRQINKILDEFMDGNMKIAKVDYDILDYTQPVCLYNHLRDTVRHRHIGNVYVALRFAEVYLVKKT